jgi:hypothetical protein
MTNPFLQIDDEVREMTDEEYAEYQKDIADIIEQAPEAE